MRRQCELGVTLKTKQKVRGRIFQGCQAVSHCAKYNLSGLIFYNCDIMERVYFMCIL